MPMVTCRSRSKLCVPALYKRLVRYSHTTRYPKIEKYGAPKNPPSCQTRTSSTPTRSLLEFIQPQIEQCFIFLSDELAHLKINQISRAQANRCPHYAPEPWFPEPMFHFVAHVSSLRSLHWETRGMTIHVDDILRILQSFPHLMSIQLGGANVVYAGHDSPTL